VSAAKTAAAQPAVSDAQRQQIIAEFLESTGQYVTNDASREAALTGAYAKGWQDGSSETVRLLSEPAKKLIGWRTPDYLYETSDRAKAKSWEPSVGALPIFEGDPNTKLTPEPAAQPASENHPDDRTPEAAT
jgi:hypothetical protein